MRSIFEQNGLYRALQLLPTRSIKAISTASITESTLDCVSALSNNTQSAGEKNQLDKIGRKSEIKRAI